MPLRDYVCQHCGSDFEVLVRVAEDTPTECESCGSPDIECQISMIASIRGDTSFHAGRKSMLDQFDGDKPYLRRFEREYRKQTGMSLPSDGVYLGQLAEGRFDASAVIRPTQGQAEVEKLIERKAAKHRAKRNQEPVRLAEDIVQKTMNNYRKSGDTSPASELRKKVIETHGRKI